MIYVIATSQVKPELRDAFIKGAKECIEATRKEKGCLSYESHASINDRPINESERKIHWDRSSPRPAQHPGLSDLGL